MHNPTGSQWTSFRAVFDRAHVLGRDHVEIAEALLSLLSRNPPATVARGIRRQGDFNEDQSVWVERLPRETEPLKVPASIWVEIQSVGDDVTSYWGDGRPDELDICSVSVDWVSGAAREVSYCRNWNLIKTEWQGLEIPTAAVPAVFGDAAQISPVPLRPSEDDRVRYVVDAVRRRISQDASRNRWFEMHPGERGRDSYNLLYKEKYQEIHGTALPRGRPRKFAN